MPALSEKRWKNNAWNESLMGCEEDDPDSIEENSLLKILISSNVMIDALKISVDARFVRRKRYGVKS